jgi:hypothetical protein
MNPIYRLRRYLRLRLFPVRVASEASVIRHSLTDEGHRNWLGLAANGGENARKTNFDYRGSQNKTVLIWTDFKLRLRYNSPCIRCGRSKFIEG